MSNDRNSSRSSLLLLATFAVAVIAVGWLVFRPEPPPVDPPEEDKNTQANMQLQEKFTEEQFQKAVEAVAATEEADFARARSLWAELIEVFPDDADLRINQAVAVLKWIDTIDQALSSNDSKLTQEERESLVKEIDSAYEFSARVTSELADLDTYDFRVPLIRSAIINSKANRVQYPDDIELRRQAALILAEALDEDPAQPLLAGSYDLTLLVLAGADEELEAKRRDILFEGWKADPRNLYLLRQAAEALLSDQDPRIIKLLEPSIDLTQPMWSRVQRDVDRVKPLELVSKVEKAIATGGDWGRDVRRNLFYWLNALKGMPSFHPDSKRVNPDPLVLLDTTFLARLAPPKNAPAPTLPLPKYESLASQSPATAAVWYDFDFDLEFDVVAANGIQLEFLKLDGNSLNLTQELQTTKPIRGILPVDLFEVQTPAAPKLPSTVAELMIANSTAKKATSENQGEESGKYGSRHESLQELLLWGEEGIQVVTADNESLEFAVVDSDLGLDSVKNVKHVCAADIESDGDLDLLVVSDSGIQLFQNNGNRTFMDLSSFSIHPPSDVSVQRAITVDIDRDMDQDFVLVTGGEAAVFENLLHGHFRYHKLESEKWKQTIGASDIAVGDFDKNVSWDFLAVGARGASLTTTICTGPGSLSALKTETVAAEASELSVGDLNNDGLLDIVLVSEKGMNVQLGAAEGGFGSQQAIAPQPSNSLSLIDRNYDGSLDILAISGGKPTVWTSSTAVQGNFVDVRVAGINDVNGGGRINHYCVGSTLEIWAGNELFSRPVQLPVTHFGLGDATPDNLRITFTNGLTQNIENVDSDILVEEIQLMRGSCPYVYGWNGERFELITDLLWNAPLGLQVARGETMPDRRWEHLLLPGELIQEKDGKIELRITEELWEIAYFDNIQLTAVDHPEDVRVFTNEKVGPPDIAQPTLFTALESLHPVAAKDTYGADVTRLLHKTDRQFAQAFRHTICQGLCEPHFIELDFGKLPVDSPLRLFLNGWLYPTDTSLNIGISQNPMRNPPEAPSLWVVDESGKWICANPIMGFPGGKPKSIVVDLQGIFRSDDHRIRIAGSQQLYWDEAFVSWDSDASLIKSTKLEIESAHLRYRGYSKFLPRESDQPHWFDYDQVTTAALWPELDGPFTRFGDVLPLLQDDDDRLVVVTSGDEIQLTFASPDRPLPAGWKRDFVMHNTGWDKDADINTLAGQGSLPLPFMNQTSYPPSVDQYQQSQEVWQKNSGTLTRLRQYIPRSITQ